MVAKYTGCGNQPNGTSRFCLKSSAACTSPGPPTMSARWVAHATEKTLTMVRALPARIASAASCGAEPAQTIPPPAVDVHISCVVPKCAR